MNWVFDTMFARLQAFRRSQDGSAALIFGLAFIPILCFVGTAIDYSRANSVRADMQAALDGTALMLAKNAATQNSSQLQQSADSVFLALFNRPEATNVQVTSSYSSQSGNSTLTVSGSATVRTDFLSMVKSQINVSTSSQVSWGTMKLWVSLVLDNTGSMNDNGKMTSLQTASHQLLQQLQSAAKNPGDVQVAIIPFTTDVNVGASNLNSSLIDWSNWSPNGSIENGLDCSKKSSKCGSSNHSAWNGCVMDRTQPYDTTNTTPVSGTVATEFPADQSAWCPVSMMPLSYDWTALNNKIDAMVANGDTNQTVGLVWGWQALTQGAPLNAPVLPPNTQQVIIILTDGLNTQNRWTYNAAQIDARTAAVCSNIKAAGIQVYTVLVMSGDSQILQQCASTPGMYFALTTSGEIVTTFNQIGTSLAQLYLSK